MIVAEAKSAPVGKLPLVALSDEREIRRCAGATAAEQIDIGFNKLAGYRGSKCLAAPGRDRNTDATIAYRCVLLINAWGVHQRDIAWAACEIAIGGNPALEVRLRRVRETAAGQCRRQREILRSRQAIINHDIGYRHGSVAGQTGHNAWISTGGKAGKAVCSVRVGGCHPASKSNGHAADGITAAGGRNCALQRASHRRRAAGKAECPDACVERQPGGLVVHVGVPESAAIGIKRHGAIVAPARARCAASARLRSGALDERCFVLRDRIHWVAGQASCIADSWI